MKTITIRQMAIIKRVAQNVNPLVNKKLKIQEKVKELQQEYNTIQEEIEGHEMGIKTLTGGFTSEDLIVKKIEVTDKLDKEGRPIKVTKYEPREDAVVLNEDNNLYEIIINSIDETAEELKEENQ